MTTTAQARSATIEANARTVRQLLGEKYAIDYYQRGYVWEERQIGDLISDLTEKFLYSYDPDHDRREVRGYGRYFLGSIVISERDQRFIVDGQQRLTTLTLLLIHLLHESRDDRVDVRHLIYSEQWGEKSFNLDISDRHEVMHKLMEGDRCELSGASTSVRNIAARYENIADYLPKEVTGHALPYFVDWLLHNVDLVEIAASSSEDAYTIFETMNQRGMSLSMPDMLKGYVLANVRTDDARQELDEKWQEHMQCLKELGDEEDVDFFKNWLRAQHAEVIRERKKGSKNRDYERIASEFHRWVRDKRGQLGLAGPDGLPKPDAFARFVSRDLDFYARRYILIRKAARKLTPGWESIYYSANRRFTLQTQALLASLTPDDDPEDIQRKVALVADFLDIWLARRVWNFRTISYSSVKYALFNLTKELRGKDVDILSEFLLDRLDRQRERFSHEPDFRLHGQNHRQVKHILARLAHWADRKCDLSSSFRDLRWSCDIEHIWASGYDRFKSKGWFSDRSDFAFERGRLGGLLLLPRGVNRSLGDAGYEEKRKAYLAHGQNILARSLHPDAYENLPAFRRLRERTGLPFRPYDSFGPEQLEERQELYVKIAERVWCPSRLELDAKKEDAS